ncbi:MAG: NHL repeat-containing protein [Treponema sp.]|nr:NHL repeat-containing protein [Treponema sp.]
MKRTLRAAAILGLFLRCLLPAQAQQSGGIGGTDQAAIQAQEEFRLGVQAYNRYAFNEAILSFEQALSFRPGEALILDWLGRSYYRSGLESSAIAQWQAALGAYGTTSPESILLSSKIETVRNRRTLLSRLDEEIRYVEAGHYPGRYDSITAYRQPTAVLPLEDGSAWVAAYGSNEIIRIDVNGVIRERRRGPINGFDRPYDIIRGEDGKLFVSEFRGGRISVLDSSGAWLSYIGSRGLGPGQLLGPANMALDEEGYLYVVEYGSRRISKFDPDGTFILSFGSKSAEFPGFLSPTGIAAGMGRVYVADAVSKSIYMFDGNGRYLGILLAEGLRGPESLRFSGEKLLAADTNRILLVDLNSAIITELAMAGNSQVRITGADVDRNGNILAANFNNDEILVLTPIDEMASGLFVSIDRVDASQFPLVRIELQVQDRKRRPIVGLGAGNFLLSENNRSAAEQSFLYAGYLSKDTQVSVLLERSPATASLGDDLAAAVRDINAALGQPVSLVSAAEQPFRERMAGEGSLVSATSLARAARGSAASYSQAWRFDLGLRLATTDLLQGSGKKALVYVGSGRLGERAFEAYSLAELAVYMANNNIAFYAVIVGNNSTDAAANEDIRYLCEATGGVVMPLYRSQGIGPVLEGLRESPSGTYILSYRSGLPTDFGRAYLPVEAEVYLLDRSGRDATGYFPPLE